MNHVNKWCNDNQYPIIMMKYAAACSMTQSPNDQGRMHTILHKSFSQTSFRYGDIVVNDPPGKAFRELKTLLQSKLDGSSFNTVWKCIQHAQMFLNKAFTQQSVLSAFKKSGVYPYDPKIILSHCPHFQKMTQDKAEFLHSKIPELVDLCEQHGIVPEEDYDRILSQYPEVDNCPIKLTGKRLNDKVPNRQRSAILTNESFLESAQVGHSKKRKVNDIDDGQQQITPQFNNDDEISLAVTSSGNNNSGKKERQTRCSLCHDPLEPDTDWSKCDKKKCRSKFCQRESCKLRYISHCRECIGGGNAKTKKT